MTDIHLIIQYVNDHRPARQAEYEECVRRNLANPHVASIHDLQERANVVVPEEIARHPKFARFELGRWLTFRDAFEHANRILPGKLCGIVNLDIFLDPGIDSQRIAMLAANKVVLCLSRTEWDGDQNTYRDPQLASSAFAASQDAWLFRAPVAVDRCEFELGTLGCDNAIAERFRQAGYLPVNAPQQFRVFHYDRARGKTLQNQRELYAAERRDEGRGIDAAREGHYLLPDFDMIKSVDQLMQSFKASDLQRYAIICDVYNRFVRVTTS